MWIPENALLYAWLRAAHGVLAYAFFAVILLHVGAALYHALIRRDGVWQAMAGVRSAAVSEDEH
jgi:cytochrome b561